MPREQNAQMLSYTLTDPENDKNAERLSGAK